MKNTIKIFICRILFYTGLLHLYLRFVLLRRNSFPAVIVNYHSFVSHLDKAMELDACVTHRIQDFEREVKFLKKYFDVASLDAVVERLRNGKRFERPTVVITVDDGYKNNYELLFPAIEANGVPVAIFLTTGLIGTAQKIWVNRLADIFYATKTPALELNGSLKTERLPLNTLEQKRRSYMTILRRLKDVNIETRDEYLRRIEQQLGTAGTGDAEMLTWEQASEMAKKSVTFGAHTCFHPILTHMPLQDAQKEIANSKTIIEERLGVPVKHFAFPNGRPQDFNEELRAYCQKIGFESVSTCDYGNNRTSHDIFALKRIGASSPVSLFAVNVVRAFNG